MSDFGGKVQRNYLKEVHQHCERIASITREMYERGEGFRDRCLEHEKESDEMLRHLDETASTVEDIAAGSPPRKDRLDPDKGQRRRTSSLEPGRPCTAEELLQEADTLEKQGAVCRRQADDLKHRIRGNLV